MSNEAALQSFKHYVCDHAQFVDPTDQYDWFSLSIGYFLGIGCTMAQARELAKVARYDLLYWQNP